MNLLKGTLVGLIILNVVVPLTVLKVAYLDNWTKLNKQKKEYLKVVENTASLTKVMEKKDSFAGLIRVVAGRKEMLERKLPQELSLIEIQQFLAQQAKLKQITIISLTPLSESKMNVKNEKNEKSKNNDNKEKEEDTLLLDRQNTLLQLKLKGSYAGLMAYVKSLEEQENVVAILEQMNMELTDVSDHYEVELSLKMRFFHV